MDRIKAFFKTSLLGGTVVILPVVILIFVFNWVFNFVTNHIQPLTNMVIKRYEIPRISADVFVIFIIIMICFTVGVFVTTRLGKFVHRSIENRILKAAPGYSLIKETIVHILGEKESPFRTVALARIFGNDTMVSAFVTDRHADGSFTVFVPTGPNPTSGNIFHLKGENVYPVNVPVEEVMRSIISCGAGSKRLIADYYRKYGSEES
ncbi:MAG: DUF502 domain-containing protein [Deltaproteobacteria bacterium]|nr:DUF502 domain-containing protein [Deltaproteobacteria bacterium]